MGIMKCFPVRRRKETEDQRIVVCVNLSSPVTFLVEQKDDWKAFSKHLPPPNRQDWVRIPYMIQIRHSNIQPWRAIVKKGNDGTCDWFGLRWLWPHRPCEHKMMNEFIRLLQEYGRMEFDFTPCRWYKPHLPKLVIVMDYGCQAGWQHLMIFGMSLNETNSCATAQPGATSCAAVQNEHTRLSSDEESKGSHVSNPATQESFEEDDEEDNVTLVDYDICLCSPRLSTAHEQPLS